MQGTARAGSSHLVEIVQNLGSPQILVLGDAILDRYIWGDAERVSQEAPVILLRADRDEVRLGGAANVANMLRGLGAEVSLATVLGEDADGSTLRRELQASGIGLTAVLTDAHRPTTVKERFIGRAQNRHPHQMLRVDREMRTPLEASIEAKLLEHVIGQLASHKAVLISDYGKGVCTAAILTQVIDAARNAGIPVIVDPRPGTDYSPYRGATAITPNRLETRLATGCEIRTGDDALAAGRMMCRELQLDHVYVTLDSDGIALVTANGEGNLFPTRKRQVYDITGAGDMVLAAIGVGLAAGIDPVDIARLANVAGGLEVERVGVVPISREEILADLLANSRSAPDKVCAIAELEKHVAVRRKLGQRIVLTNGCFDILHAGHVACLQQAAEEGDCLIVALNSDASVRGLNKSPERPIFDQRHRAAVVAALEAVDYVVVFDETTPHALLERLKPDLLVKGGTYRDDEIVGRELVEGYGGRVMAVGQVPGVSTTYIVDQILDADEKIPTPHFPMAVPVPDPARNGMTASETLQILKKLKWPSAPAEGGMKIAVFCPNWVGDMVMATAALRAVRRQFARAEIVAVVRPYVADVLDGLDLVDRRLLHDPWNRAIRPAGHSSRGTRGWQFARRLRAERFDVALVLPNSFRSAFWALASGARRRIGFARDGRGWLLTDPVVPRPRTSPHPVIDEYLRLAKRLGCRHLTRRMELATNSDDERRLEAFWESRQLGDFARQGVVCLNPGGAFGAAKHWPVTSFAQLALRLALERNKRVLVLCGPAEHEEARQIVRLARHPAVVSLADESPSIGLTKSAIRQADLLVTTDSGPRHFAPPFQVPVVTLFGPTHPAWSETYYERALHLQVEVDCGPCQQRVCPVKHHRCMRELSVGWVFKAAATLLDSFPAQSKAA